MRTYTREVPKSMNLFGRDKGGREGAETERRRLSAKKKKQRCLLIACQKHNGTRGAKHRSQPYPRAAEVSVERSCHQ